MSKKIPVQYEITDDVPVPVHNVTKMIRDLGVGQSFEFPTHRRASVQSLASREKVATGKSFTVHVVSMKTCRIWRVT